MALHTRQGHNRRGDAHALSANQRPRAPQRAATPPATPSKRSNLAQLRWPHAPQASRPPHAQLPAQPPLRALCSCGRRHPQRRPRPISPSPTAAPALTCAHPSARPASARTAPRHPRPAAARTPHLPCAHPRAEPPPAPTPDCATQRKPRTTFLPWVPLRALRSAAARRRTETSDGLKRLNAWGGHARPAN